MPPIVREMTSCGPIHEPRTLASARLFAMADDLQLPECYRHDLEIDRCLLDGDILPGAQAPRPIPPVFFWAIGDRGTHLHDAFASDAMQWAGTILRLWPDYHWFAYTETFGLRPIDRDYLARCVAHADRHGLRALIEK